MSQCISSKARGCIAIACGLALLAASSHPAPGLTKIKTKLGIEMVLIPAGEFMMGSNTGGADEKPVHKVKVSAFYMDTHLVTQRSYEALMRTLEEPHQPRGTSAVVRCGKVL